MSNIVKTEITNLVDGKHSPENHQWVKVESSLVNRTETAECKGCGAIKVDYFSEAD